MKKQKPAKSHRQKVYKLIIFIVFVVVAIAIIIPVANTLQARRVQLEGLEKASDDLYALQAVLIADLKIDSQTASFKKRCGQSSAKFHSGGITCGPRGEFTQDLAYSTVRTELRVEQILRKDGLFESIRVENFDSDTNEPWTLLEFKHINSGIKCFISLFSSSTLTTKYSLGCNETVPDFLPGYERE